jgi:hypothetical protein
MMSFRSLLAAVVTALALALGFGVVAASDATTSGSEHACSCCVGACECAEQVVPDCGCEANVERPELPAVPPEAPTPHHTTSAARATRTHEPWLLPSITGPPEGARPVVSAAIRFGNDFRQGRRRHGVLSVWRE